MIGDKISTTAKFRALASAVFTTVGSLLLAQNALAQTPYAAPSCTANDANVTAIATDTFSIQSQCAAPTDTATVEYNIIYTQNAQTRYDLLLGAIFENQVITQDVFSAVRVGGENPFLDLDGEADYGDVRVTDNDGVNVVVRVDFPCDPDNDGVVNASPTINFAMGYNVRQGGRGLPSQITGPKCTISDPVTFPLTTSLTIQKTVINDNAGTSTVDDFNIQTSAGSLTFDAGVTSGNQTTYTSNELVALSPGTYSLTESDLIGYTEGTWSCSQGTVVSNSATSGSVNLTNGDNAVCTITNNDLAVVPPTTATLTLAKSVINDDGLSAVPTDWTLAYSDGGVNSGSGVSGSAAVTSVTVAPGTYTLSESGGPDAYQLTGINCSGGADTNGQDGLTLTAGEDVTCTFVNNDNPLPTGTFTKVADDTTQVVAGQTLTYTYTFTNTGNVDVNNVSVSDSHNGAGTLSAISPASVASVAPGAQAVFTATYVVQQADIDAGTAITNSASLNATPEGGTLAPLTADESVTVEGVNPALTLTKTADDTTDVVEGQTITYSYEVTNSGNVDMNNVSISDSHSGSGTLSSISPTSVNLVPGASQTFTATYVVTQIDIDAGVNITNTATANATPAAGAYTPVTADETVDVADPAPAVTFTKTADDTTDVTVGQTITYSYDVTNTGNVTLVSVGVTDNHSGSGSLSAITPASIDLAPGESQTFTATYVVTQADINAGVDITNTAQVDATSPAGAITPVTANESVDLADPAPAASMIKTADDTTDVVEGQTINYSYEVTNTGNVTLNNLSVTDTHNGAGTLSSITPASVTGLDPGDSVTFTATYVVTQADIDAGADITNLAELSATPAGGSLGIVVANEVVDVADPAPAATMNKTADDTTEVEAGQLITYSYEITNTGNVTLSNLSVSDTHNGAGTLSAISPASVASLAPGASTTFTATYTVTQEDIDNGSDITNTANLTASPQGGTLAPVSDNESVDVADPAPAVNFTKTADRDVNLAAGDTVTYTYRVENTGNVTLRNLSVSDVHDGDNSLSAITPANVSALAPSGVATFTSTYVVNANDVSADRDITNTATLSATPDQGVLATTTAFETISLINPAPALTLTKTADDTTDVVEGQTLTYSYEVTNSGNVVMNNVNIADNHSGSGTLSTVSPASVDLNPGQSQIFIATYVVTQNDIDAGVDITNTATANATPAAGAYTPVTADETVDVADPAPAVTFTKTADDTTDVVEGQTITYSYEVTNAGNVTLVSVGVTDNHSGSGSLSAISPASVDLQPGESQIFTATYVVTQADIDAGVDITNTAQVDAISPVGAITPVTANESVDVAAPAPAATMTKTADDTTDAVEGQTITYSYEVTNTGNVTLNNLSVTDAHNGAGTLSSITPSSVTGLDPGDSVTFTATYVVTQADIDAGVPITNTADLNATPAGGALAPVSASESVDVADPVPAATMNKTADDTTEVEAGQLITYTYEITNTGNVTLNNLSVSDTHNGAGTLSAINPTSVASLDPGASTTFTATYTVTQDDIDNGGAFTNTADLNATPSTGTLAPVSDNESVDVADPTPAVIFTKIADNDANRDVGDVITYTYSVENTGNVTLNNVSVSDVHDGDNALSAITPANVASLAPGDIVTFTSTYTVNQNDIDSGRDITNTATLSATPAQGILSSTTAFEVVDLIDPAPQMSLTKTASDTTDVAVNDVITYSYEVINTGNVAITGISVSDSHSGSGTLSAITPASADLQPGESQIFTATYTVTQDDINAGVDITNTATATGTPASGTLNSPSDTERVDVADAAPSVTFTKTADQTSNVQLGETITYSYAVTNTGNVTLSGVSVSDSHSGAGSLSAITPSSVGLEPGENQTFTATYTVTQADIDAGADITNTATLNATPAGGTLPPSTADESVDLDDPSPAMAVTKTASDTVNVQAGDTITYTYTAENTGNVSLSNVSVSDAHSGAGTLSAISPANVPSLAIGATATFTATYTVTQADIDAGVDITNTATFSATPASGALAPQTANETVDIDDASPQISFTKTASDTTNLQVGDVVTYSYRAENTGNVSISNVSVSDAHNGSGSLSAISPASVPTLSVGQVVTFTATYTVTQADIDSGAAITNTATITGTPAQGVLPTTTADESVSVEAPAPALTMAKTSISTGFSAVGDVISYEYIVTNTGNVSVIGLSVSDDKIASVSCPVTTLAPGENTTCTASYSVTQADLDAGFVTNNASADATPSGGALTPATDSETVNGTQSPAMTITKTALDSDFSAVGDQLDYEYLVINTGNVEITGLSVSDDKIATVNCPVTTLAPGAQTTCTASYFVTQSDLDDGIVTNIATANGTPSGGTLTPPADSAVVNGSQIPSLAMVKTSAETSYAAVGDSIDYDYEVTNTGNVTVTDPIVVNDDKITAPNMVSCPALPSGGLVPGASLTCSATYIVTQADLDNGSVTNVASATDGNVTSPTDSVTINAAQSPALTMAKDAVETSYAAVGDELNYNYTVTNTGNVRIGSIAVTDDKIASVSCGVSSVGNGDAFLDPGEVVVCTGLYTVTQADLNAGSVTNIADVSGAPAGGTLAPVSATETVDATQSPALTMTKTAGETSFDAVGDVLTYSYVVTNSGNVAVSDLVVTDDKIASVSCDVSAGGNGDTVLDPSEAVTCTASYSVTQADLDAGSVTNNASASGTPGGGALTPATAQETVNADQNPAMETVKTAVNVNFTSPGDTVDYEYVVTNTGNTTITSAISVTDNLVAVSCPAIPSGGLAPGASLTCTSTYLVTQADLDNGSVTNLAFSSDGTTDSPQTSETIPADANPAITIVKRALTADYDSVGDVLTYEFDVTNSGNLTLTGGIDVVDDRIGTISCVSGNLFPGETQTCSATYTVTQADIDAGFVTNEAFAQNGTLTSPVDTATVNAVINPALTMDKRAVSGNMNTAGNVISYEYEVTNSGNITIDGIAVSDDKIASVICPVTTLVPAQSTICNADYTVTQADIDNGFVTNNASVTGNPANGVLTPATDSETVTASQSPSLAFEKTALDTSFAMAGDVLDYTYRVENTGNVTISGIAVSDDKIASVSCPKTTLVPGDVIICTASYTVTQTDVNDGSVTNNASVDGTPSGGTLAPQTDAVTVNGAQTPELTVTKIATVTDYTSVGDVLSYNFIVENTGNISVSAIALSDDKIGAVSCPQTTLEPTEQMTCSADYTVTQADIDAGSVTNIATATGTAAGGTLAPATDNATVSGTQTPALSVVKTAQTSSFDAVGDSIAYDYVVTNSGNTTITSAITITDDRIATVNCDTLPSGGLTPGSTLSCSAVYIVTQADIDNGSVTNLATASDGTTTSPQVSETVNAVQAPSLRIAKTANETSFDAVGDVLTYDYAVTNNGNVTITNPISVTDDRIPSVSCPALPAGGLAPSASIRCTASYSVTQSDLDAGRVTNLASASDGTTTSPTVSRTVNADQNPSLSVAKSAREASFATAGDSLTYDYVVTNNGNVTLTGALSVSDDKISSVSCPSLPPAGLAPGAQATCTAVYMVTQDDIDAGSVTNIASANLGGITSPTDSATVTATQNPSLSMEKIADTPSFDAVGDVLSYRYRVRNSGNVSFTGNISVSDDRIVSVSCPALPVSGLAPGDEIICSATYLVTQADLDAGWVTNIASASGTPVAGAPVTSPSDSATVNADQNSALSVIKTAAESTYRNVGDVLNYTYLVTNSGNVTITAAVSVSDDKIATVNCPALPAGGLLPGQSITCSANYTVTQADIDNGSVTNIATATDGTVTSAPVTERVVGTRLESLETVKTATNINFTLPGDIVSYEYVVTNTGNTTVTNSVSVMDNRIANVTCPALPAGGLAPAASITCTADYVVTQDDLDVGVVTNVASATDGNTTSALTSETIPANRVPAIELRKSSTDTSFSMVGDVLSYSYEIENTGNVTLTGVVEIIDDKIGRFTCYTGNFIPGQIETCTADYTVTQADIDRGFVTNDAFAENFRASSPPDFVTINADQMPALSVVKTAGQTSYDAVGDVLTYDYVVTNSGNVSITFPISVSDDRIAAVNCPDAPSGGLAPGASLTCTASYTVTQADLDAGSVTNIATASDGFTTSAPVSETVTADQQPELSIDKLAQSSDFENVGDKLSYTYLVTNTGNVTLTSAITVSDDKIPSVSCPALPSGGLGPNATLTCTADYTVTQDDLDAGSVTNIATASDGTTTSAPDTATITGTQSPSIEMVKSAGAASYTAAGEIVSYDYVITNTGNVTLTTAFTVSDDKIATVNCPALPAGGLAPTESLTCTADYTITQADVDNGSVTNLATATDGTVSSPQVSETIDAAQAPGLTVAKTALTSGFAAAGDGLDYEYVVTNSGNTTITDAIRIDDDRIGVVSCPALPSDGLLPGASITCTASDTVNQADVNAGTVTNIATATDGDITSTPVSETVSGDQTPQLTLEKTAQATEYTSAGESIEYRYVVTNSGNITITDPVSVTDDRIASVSCPALPSGGLVPGAQLVCSATDTVSQSDLDTGSVVNIASASDGTTTSPDVTETVTATQNPALTIAKSSAQTEYATAGDVLSYEYVVTNSGNVTLTGAISVSDDKIASVSCPALPSGGLAPGDSLLCSADYTVMQEDIDSGSVTNIATATDGTTTSDPDSVTINAAQTRALTIAKSSLDDSYISVGDVLSYEYIVTNSGNVTITDAISVSDDKIAAVTCPALPSGGLAPAQTLTCSADYAVTQEDIDAGSVTNIATATDGTTVSPQDSVIVDANRMPDLAVTKSVSELIQVGGPIYDVEYTITAENTGNVSLTDFTLTDDLSGVIAPAVFVETPSVTVSGLTAGSANESYDGVSDVNLITSGSSLDVGASAIATIRLRIDTTAGGPSQPNTAFGGSPELPADVPSNDPGQTPDEPGDTQPTPLTIIDTDGDGVPDIYELPTEDRDGDGVPDNEDYDPTGYFYCEETGDILTGGGITITGPTGSNASIGSQNNITIVQDGSQGFYQFFVTQPGRYTLTPSYPSTGVASTDRTVQNIALDVTSMLPANPAVLGSTEFGATGRLADFTEAANNPFYFEFDIEPGDPNVLANNIPLKFCGEPNIAVTKSVPTPPVQQADDSYLVSYELTAENTGETLVQDLTLMDDLGDVFSDANIVSVTTSISEAPNGFAATLNNSYDGVTDVNLLSAGGELAVGERVVIALTAIVTPQEARDYINTAEVGASAPLDGAALSGTGDAPITINSVTDAALLRVSKEARPRTVQIGDPVLYTITVENPTASNMGNLRITDQLPYGFSYVPGSSQLLTDTDSIDVEPVVEARGRIIWDITSANAAPFDGLRGGESVQVNLQVLAGPNVQFGSHDNRAFVESLTNGSISDVAIATVDYIPEPSFDCTPVIGRVFDDVNHNGYPDDGEPGLPSVRLVTVNGDIITTDKHGRYHIPCAAIADSEIGSNFLLKADVRTLPLGYSPTSENPRVVRATRGKFVKMNFGAAYLPKLRIDVYAEDFQGDVLTEVAQSRITNFALANMNSERAVLLYHAKDGEGSDMAQMRLSRVESLVQSTSGGKLRDIAKDVSWGTPISFDPEAIGMDGREYTGRKPSEVKDYRKDLFGEFDHEGAPSASGGLRGVDPGAYEGDRQNAGMPGRSEAGEYESRRPGRLTRWVDWTNSSSSYAEGMEIETTVDALDPVKRLSVEAFVAEQTTEKSRELMFFTYSNYHSFIDRAEVRVFSENDSTRTRPLAVAKVVGDRAWMPVAEQSGKLTYVLRVYAADGTFDETAPQTVNVGEPEYDISREEVSARSYDSYGTNILRVDNIRVRGAAVRVYGRNVGGESATVFGLPVRIDERGRFVAESLLPAGQQNVTIIVPGENGDQAIIERQVEVKAKDTFFVGLADVTIGQRVTPDADGDRDFDRGRLAFYVRSRLNDRYTLTATADTGEGEVEDLFTNLDDKSASSLLRRLDPDRYYPVYGDDSIIEEDAPTSGKFYARIERDDDYALWGNYRLTFDDTEYGRVARTLYGMKLHWDSNGNPTAYGDDRSVVEGYIAEGGSRAARDEFRGTGGSVYYLRNGDILIGGEIVRVEIRDEISGLVIESRRLVYGSDYDIDFIQGRILLNRPLSSTGSSSRIFRDGSQSGNAQFLVVDYEYTPFAGDDENAVYGLRASHWLNDNIKFGVTYNHDSDGATDSDLLGGDITLQFAPETYIKGEIAQSEGRGVTTFLSNDGGFTFDPRTVQNTGRKSMGYALEAALNLNDIGVETDGRLFAYWRDREAGFAAYGEGTNAAVKQFGGGLDISLTEYLTLKGRADITDSSDVGERSIAEASLDYKLSERTSIAAGLSYSDDGLNNSGTSFGLRAENKFSVDNTLYAFGQVNLAGENTRTTDRIGAGAEFRLSEKFYLGGELSTGEEGLGALASLRMERGDGDETYLAYELPLRARVGEKFGVLNLGARRRYSDALSVYGEERFHFDEGGTTGMTHAYGVDYRHDSGWSLGGAAEIGQVADLDRQAFSVSAGFRDEFMQAGIEGEYRTDENLTTGDVRNSWLLRTTALYKPNEELRIQGKFNTAFSDNDNPQFGSFGAAEFTEGSIAAAYRPIWDDRLNVLAKYVYLEDLSPSQQRFGGETLNYKQRSEIVSVDGSYDISPKWTLGGKYAYRRGEVTSSREAFDFVTSEAELFAARLDWHVVSDWDATLELRRLSIGDDVITRDGGLAAVYRHVNDNAKIGVGVNWGGIEEQYLGELEDEEIGWFVNMVGKF